ncbi:MAG: DUF4160 domain-containing protein [Bacteriovorax sp.]
MTTIFRFDGYRFFFYSNEGNEPPHVHVSGNGGELKVWLSSLFIDYSYGFSQPEKKIILKIIRNNQKRFRNDWSEAFKTYHGEIQILKAEVTPKLLTVYLSDERIISIPVKRFPKLEVAINSNQINSSHNLQISPSGYGIHWTDLDEDISIKAFL